MKRYSIHGDYKWGSAWIHGSVAHADTIEEARKVRAELENHPPADQRGPFTIYDVYSRKRCTNEEGESTVPEIFCAECGNRVTKVKLTKLERERLESFERYGPLPLVPDHCEILDGKLLGLGLINTIDHPTIQGYQLRELTPRGRRSLEG